MSLRRRNLKRFYSNNRKARVDDRVPPWFCYEEVRQFYIDCPEDMVVDHIAPLRGKNISGLHVLENLQYLTFEENSRKREKFGDFQGWTDDYEKEYMQNYAKEHAVELAAYRKIYREIPENKLKAKEYAKNWHAENRQKM